MHRLKFYGFSDDTFGEYGVTGDDVDNCESCEPIQCLIDCGERGRLMVIGQYSRASMGNGCWMVGISKVEENDEFPDWDIRIRDCVEVPYSLELFVELPTGDFSLTWYKNGIEVQG